MNVGHFGQFKQSEPCPTKNISLKQNGTKLLKIKSLFICFFSDQKSKLVFTKIKIDTLHKEHYQSIKIAVTFEIMMLY